MLNRTDGNYWCLPGGKALYGEHPVQCLKREVLEETGIHVNDYELIGIHTAFWDEEHWVKPTYLVRSWTGEPNIMEPEKFDQSVWFQTANFQFDIIRCMFPPCFDMFYGDSDVSKALRRLTNIQQY
jgi:8-oxo-dGTP pyrophosphatase MutT (NUDIX family)